jgi:hypothetical protein
MRPAISPSGTLFVMIPQEDMGRFRLDHGVVALGVLVHLMGRVNLDPYRTQVRSRTHCNQWFVPVTFFELQESTGMTTAALMLAIQALEAGGWVEGTENGYLLRDAAKEKLS